MISPHKSGICTFILKLQLTPAPRILPSITVRQSLTTMFHMPLDAAMLPKELEGSSPLSFVCNVSQESLSSLEEARPSSQLYSRSSIHLSNASACIQVSSPMYSIEHLPGMPNTIYVHLRFEDNRTGVPKILCHKTLLWCDYPPDASLIVAGTRLETGSVYPVSDGMFREVVHCVRIKHGRAIIEVATFCDSAGGKWKKRVWEHASFLVSFPAGRVDMPVAKLPWRWVLWNLFTSCL